jgi:hypothetical protein
MKIAKIILGIFLVLFAVIIGFIDIVGLALYIIVMGYTIIFFCLVNYNKFFAEFYRQLSRRYGENNAIGHVFSPLMLGVFLWGGLTLPNDSKFTRVDFILGWFLAVSVYFLIIFLPVIINTKRKLR